MTELAIGGCLDIDLGAILAVEAQDFRLVPTLRGDPAWVFGHFDFPSKGGLSVVRSLHKNTYFVNRSQLTLSPEIKVSKKLFHKQ